MYKCHYFICISLVISVSSVNLNFQNRRLVELMAGFDRHLTAQILNCMTSFLCLFKLKLRWYCFKQLLLNFRFRRKLPDMHGRHGCEIHLRDGGTSTTPFKRVQFGPMAGSSGTHG